MLVLDVGGVTVSPGAFVDRQPALTTSGPRRIQMSLPPTGVCNRRPRAFHAIPPRLAAPLAPRGPANSNGGVTPSVWVTEEVASSDPVARHTCMTGARRPSSAGLPPHPEDVAARHLSW